MSLKFSVLILCSLVALVISVPLPHEDVVEVDCIMGGSTHCTLQNVKLTSAMRRLEIHAPEPEEIRSIVFLKSEIEVLSTDICETFPQLEFLDLEGVGLHQIEMEAFAKCENLQSLVLAGNKLQTLDKNLFNKQAKLKYLHLNGNKLKSLPNGIFEGAPELFFLYLHNNQINQLSSYVLRDLPKLIVLSFHTNDLFDINAEDIVTLIPMLKIIEFNNNPISCVRLGDILSTFKAAHLDPINDQDPRERFYHTVEVSGFSCLEDVEWTGAYYRSVNLQNRQEEQQDEILELTHEIKTLEHEISELETLLTVKQK